jgi:hypothetical protein
MSLRLSPVLAAICICGIGLALAAGPSAPPAETTATGPTLLPWLPYETYPDGAQFDARLDESVTFWRAGLSLKEVFAGVAEQTGVEVGFWPPGDDNERFHVNLYLNPERPPVLRDLMVQIAWLTGCTFAYAEGEGADEPWSYYLLSTSVAGDAEERLEADRAEAMAAWQQEWESFGPDRAAVEAGIAEYERALGLSRRRLIARYSGVNDRLLFAMLDPPRRAAAEFALGLDAESRESLLDGEGVTLEWDSLSAAQQALLQGSLGDRWWGGRRGRRGGEPGDWEGLVPTEVTVRGLDRGMVMISAVLDEGTWEEAGAPPDVVWDTGRGRPRVVGSPMLMLAGDMEMRPEERIALRRALGETISEEEERAFRREWREARREEMEQQQRERTRDTLETRLAQHRPLSAEAEALLSSVELPLDYSTPYALWQVQEAVAAATGMHVISDCFSQPSRRLNRSREALYGEEEPEMTGLVALRLSALTVGDPRMLVWSVESDAWGGWEWHDSGQFLRFRSLARDLWRASMLSPEVAKRLDGWLTSYVETAADSEAAGVAVDVDLDVVSISKLAAALSDRQMVQGGDLTCGDPADKAARYRQMLRAGVLRAMSWATDMLRVLATLGDSQWEQLRGSGLRLAYDLTPDQRALLGVPEAEEPEVAGAVGPRGGRRGGGRQPGGGMRGGGMRGRGRFWGGPEMRSSVMRLSAEAPADRRWGGRGGRGMRGRGFWGGWLRGSPRIEVKENHYLTFWSDDEVRMVRTIPRVVTVHLEEPEETEEQGPGD